jgi:hypothetical protein
MNRNMTTLQRAALASLTALAASAAGAAAPAAHAATATDGAVALQPAGGKHRLAYTAAPGDVVHGAVRLKNAGRQARDIKLTAVDVGTAAFGGAVYGDATGKRTGRWVTLEAGTVRVGARSTKTVHFSVQVPRGTSKGVHYAGITAVDVAQLRAASTRRKRAGKRIVFHRITRFALPLKVRVPGAVSPRLTFRGAEVDVDAAGANILMKLENTGRTLLRSTDVKLRLAQGDRTLVDVHQPLREFVPGTAAKFPITLPGIPSEGDYRVVGTIRPEGAPAIAVDETVHIDGKSVKKAERSVVARTAPPADGGMGIVLYLAIGGLAVVAIGFGVAFARMRRRLNAATAAAGEQRS